MGDKGNERRWEKGNEKKCATHPSI